MAISMDKPVDEEGEKTAKRGPSPVPLGITPGYIPGMPRPMTPRTFEGMADEQRSHSTTPRATSPTHTSFSLSEAGTAAAAISTMLRRDSASSVRRNSLGRPTTPLFLQRPVNGYHPSTNHGNGRTGSVDDSRNRPASDLHSSTSATVSYDDDHSVNSSPFAGRRRPASPLSNPPLNPISAIASSPQGSPSRPTTPSNIVWKADSVSPSSSLGQPTYHSRDNSWASENDSELYVSGVAGRDDDGEGVAISGRQLPGGTSQRSPPRSHSPGPEKGHLAQSWSFRNATQAAVRSTSPVYGISNGDMQYQSHSRNNHRSLTPTQNAPRSPGSPAFGGMDSASSTRTARRASRQNGYASSPFNLGPLPLALNSRANRSTSSLESDGSSFHSWEGEKDRVLEIFNDTESQPAWHDFSGSSSSENSSMPGHSSSRTSPDEDWDPEDVIKGYAGLRKVDFAIIQEKLVAVAKATEHRGSTMRKRRPSTSQSTYSIRDARVSNAQRLCATHSHVILNRLLLKPQHHQRSTFTPYLANSSRSTFSTPALNQWPK